MSVCPTCQKRLARAKLADKVCLRCRQCDGRLVGLSVLRQLLPAGYARGLWLHAHGKDTGRGKCCPVCRRAMVEVPVPVGPEETPLDVCTGCQLVWFDPHEFERFPQRPTESIDRDRVPQSVREKIAVAEAKAVAERSRGSDFGDAAPEESWKWVLGFLGMPVEQNTNPLRSLPWITWGLAGLMAVTFLATWQHDVVEQYGLIPAEALRHGGLTLLSSFFLHAGWIHLLGNAYFLLIFGDNVEDHLGRWRYVVLVAAAALAGDVLHVMADPRSTVPCIGASGGIAGVIVFYALRFPQARLGFMFRFWLYFRWFQMPAWFALILWFLLQLLLAASQLAGTSNISALAHLGGAAVGLVAWLLWREDRRAREEVSFRQMRQQDRGAGRQDSFKQLRRDPR